MKSKVIAIALSLILVPTAVLAKDKHHEDRALSYNGPVELSSVTSLLEDTSYFSEKDVIMEGYIIRQTRKDEFIFSDGEGEIKIELDDDIQLDQTVNEETKVRIYGEYEGGSTPEVEVEGIQLL
ncbi:YgiW/YdeI family stress tolerance OB fold protein [Vibrio sp. HN007]|uniref:YgiW/YdeI family stress tolerance OB fold protein n=1 Tax=Vibrio iocasae TaxID=3098914 RepID=UPI0035D42F5E